MTDREKNLREVYGDKDSWPSAAQTLPKGPGPVGYDADEDAAELRAKNAAVRETKREAAAEQGVSVAEYERMREEQSAQEAYAASGAGRAAAAAESAAILLAMRREIGLPDGVAPDAKLCRTNGSVGVIIDGKSHYGSFTVDAAGNIVKA